MIEIDIPSIDPIQHEPKIFFGLTARQCLCIVPGGAIGIGLFVFFYNISLDAAVISLCAGLIPAVCLGWFTPYNMKCEQYVKLWWFNAFVSSPKRIYKTDSAEEIKRPTIKEIQALEKKRKSSELDDKKKNTKPAKEGL